MKIKVKIVHSKELDPGLRRDDEQINLAIPNPLSVSAAFRQPSSRLYAIR